MLKLRTKLLLLAIAVFGIGIGVPSARADVIGIDAPFGWPEAFVKAVADWRLDGWTSESRDHLQLRETNRVVRDHVGRRPLSVSTDRIALPAMRAMALLRRHGVTNRRGDGRFFEVYPAGSLFCWKLRCRGYKRIDDEWAIVRREILSELQTKLRWLDVPDSYAESADSLDALVASLTARAAEQGFTMRPNQSELALTNREGSILHT